MNKPKSNRHLYTKSFLVLAALSCVIKLGLWYRAGNSDYGANELANLPPSEISIYALDGQLVGLDGLEALRHSNLLTLGVLNTDYRLSTAVFGLVDKNAPWISQDGYYKEGYQTRRFDGAPLDGAILANPLLLVYPRFSVDKDGGAIRPTARTTDAGVVFIREPSIAAFTAHPDQNLLALTINLSSALQYSLDTTPLAHFRPVTTNANDLGYSAIRLNSANSANVEGSELGKVVLNRARFGSLPGTDTDPAVNQVISWAAIDASIASLPAKASFDLWRVPPEDLTQPGNPDLTFDIVFK